MFILNKDLPIHNTYHNYTKNYLGRVVSENLIEDAKFKKIRVYHTKIGIHTITFEVYYDILKEKIEIKYSTIKHLKGIHKLEIIKELDP